MNDIHTGVGVLVLTAFLVSFLWRVAFKDKDSQKTTIQKPCKVIVLSYVVSTGILFIGWLLSTGIVLYVENVNLKQAIMQIDKNAIFWKSCLLVAADLFFGAVVGMYLRIKDDRV